MNRRSLLTRIAGIAGSVAALSAGLSFGRSDGMALTSRAHPNWKASAEEEFEHFTRVIGTYAHKGDIVTCESGHPIVEFARDVHLGEMFDPDALTNWRQKQPQIGTMEQPCEICGKRWFKGVYMHFDNGWRI